MKLTDAVASKKPFRRHPSGRVIEVAESCGLRFFRFQKPVVGQAKETVAFAPEDFEIEWSLVEDAPKDPTPLERAMMACEILKNAIRDLAGGATQTLDKPTHP